MTSSGGVRSRYSGHYGEGSGKEGEGAERVQRPKAVQVWQAEVQNEYL